MARKRKPRVRTPTPPNGNAAPRKPLSPAASPASGMFPGAPIALAGAALCLLVAVSYFPALSAGFLWDDRILTESTPLRTWPGLAQIWFTPRGLIRREFHYWPLLYTTFWLEHKLWGLAPLGYHLVNLLLHTGVVLLLWRLLRRLEVPGAWFAAAVFAVHPLHVESVAWVIGRKDILATAFYLAAVLAYIRFAEMRRWRHYGLAMALFVLGLLSKSIAITLPVALLLWHWWRHGRVTLADFRRTLPFFLVGLGIALADYAYYASHNQISFAYSPLERGLIAARALAFYAGKLLWPTGLAGIYPRWEPGIGDALAWGGAAGFAAVVAVLWRWRRPLGRGPLAGVLFFAVALSPTLGFVDNVYMEFSFVADRYQYLAGIGLIAVVAAAAGRACQRSLGALPAHRMRPARLAIGVVGAVILAVAGLLTWHQTGLYRDPGTFFTHVIAHNPQARGAHHNLATHLLAERRYGEAHAAFQTALEQRPDSPGLLNDIGALLGKQGRHEEAIAHYREVLRLRPQYQSAMINLAGMLVRTGTLLFRQGRHEEANARYGEAHAAYQTALEQDPNDPGLRSSIGVLLSKQGHQEEATARFREALRLDPRHQNAMRNLAVVLMKQRRYAEGLAAAQQMIARYPDDAHAHQLAGLGLFHLNRKADALRHYDRALVLNPNLTIAREQRKQFFESTTNEDRQ